MENNSLLMNNIDTLCLSCGGVKCFSFIGSIEYMINILKLDLNNINKFYGTSGGAILNFLINIGYTIDEIKIFLLEFDFSKLINKNIDIEKLLVHKGFDNGNKFIYVLEEMLYLKLNKKNITFIDLYNLTKKELYIIGTNFSKGTEKCFSYKTTPNLNILTALRISFSMPYMLYPVLYENDYYIDGAIINSFPIEYCDQNKTIGIYIKYTNTTNNKTNNNITNIFDIYKKSLNILCDSVVENKCVNYNNIITVIPDKSNVKGFTNLNINKEHKLYLIELGYKCAKIHFDNIFS